MTALLDTKGPEIRLRDLKAEGNAGSRTEVYTHNKGNNGYE